MGVDRGRDFLKTINGKRPKEDQFLSHHKNRYAVLRAAHDLKERKEDVFEVYIDNRSRDTTSYARCNPTENIPPREVLRYNGLKKMVEDLVAFKAQEINANLFTVSDHPTDRPAVKERRVGDRGSEGSYFPTPYPTPSAEEKETPSIRPLCDKIRSLSTVIVAKTEADPHIAELVKARVAAGAHPGNLSINSGDVDIVFMVLPTDARFVFWEEKFDDAKSSSKSSRWVLLDLLKLHRTADFPWKSHSALAMAATLTKNDYSEGVLGLGLTTLSQPHKYLFLTDVNLHECTETKDVESQLLVRWDKCKKGIAKKKGSPVSSEEDQKMTSALKKVSSSVFGAWEVMRGGCTYEIFSKNPKVIPVEHKSKLPRRIEFVTPLHSYSLSPFAEANPAYAPPLFSQPKPPSSRSTSSYRPPLPLRVPANSFLIHKHRRQSVNYRNFLVRSELKHPVELDRIQDKKEIWKMVKESKRKLRWLDLPPTSGIWDEEKKDGAGLDVYIPKTGAAPRPPPKVTQVKGQRVGGAIAASDARRETPKQQRTTIPARTRVGNLFNIRASFACKIDSAFKRLSPPSSSPSAPWRRIGPSALLKPIAEMVKFVHFIGILTANFIREADNEYRNILAARGPADPLWQVYGSKEVSVGHFRSYMIILGAKPVASAGDPDNPTRRLRLASEVQAAVLRKSEYTRALRNVPPADEVPRAAAEAELERMDEAEEAMEMGETWTLASSTIVGSSEVWAALSDKLSVFVPPVFQEGTKEWYEEEAMSIASEVRTDMARSVPRWLLHVVEASFCRGLHITVSECFKSVFYLVQNSGVQLAPNVEDEETRRACSDAFTTKKSYSRLANLITRLILNSPISAGSRVEETTIPEDYYAQLSAESALVWPGSDNLRTLLATTCLRFVMINVFVLSKGVIASLPSKGKWNSRTLIGMTGNDVLQGKNQSIATGLTSYVDWIRRLNGGEGHKLKTLSSGWVTITPGRFGIAMKYLPSALKITANWLNQVVLPVILQTEFEAEREARRTCDTKGVLGFVETFAGFKGLSSLLLEDWLASNTSSEPPKIEVDEEFVKLFAEEKDTLEMLIGAKGLDWARFTAAGLKLQMLASYFTMNNQDLLAWNRVGSVSFETDGSRVRPLAWAVERGKNDRVLEKFREDNPGMETSVANVVTWAFPKEERDPEPSSLPSHKKLQHYRMVPVTSKVLQRINDRKDHHSQTSSSPSPSAPLSQASATLLPPTWRIRKLPLHIPPIFGDEYKQYYKEKLWKKWKEEKMKDPIALSDETKDGWRKSTKSLQSLEGQLEVLCFISLQTGGTEIVSLALMDTESKRTLADRARWAGIDEGNVVDVAITIFEPPSSTQTDPEPSSPSPTAPKSSNPSTLNPSSSSSPPTSTESPPLPYDPLSRRVPSKRESTSSPLPTTPSPPSLPSHPSHLSPHTPPSLPSTSTFYDRKATSGIIRSVGKHAQAKINAEKHKSLRGTFPLSASLEPHPEGLDERKGKNFAEVLLQTSQEYLDLKFDTASRNESELRAQAQQILDRICPPGDPTPCILVVGDQALMPAFGVHGAASGKAIVREVELLAAQQGRPLLVVRSKENFSSMVCPYFLCRWLKKVEVDLNGEGTEEVAPASAEEDEDDCDVCGCGEVECDGECEESEQESLEAEGEKGITVEESITADSEQDDGPAQIPPAVCYMPTFQRSPTKTGKKRKGGVCLRLKCCPRCWRRFHRDRMAASTIAFIGWYWTVYGSHPFARPSRGEDKV